MEYYLAIGNKWLEFELFYLLKPQSILFVALIWLAIGCFAGRYNDGNEILVFYFYIPSLFAVPYFYILQVRFIKYNNKKVSILNSMY